MQISGVMVQTTMIWSGNNLWKASLSFDKGRAFRERILMGGWRGLCTHQTVNPNRLVANERYFKTPPRRLVNSGRDMTIPRSKAFASYRRCMTEFSRRIDQHYGRGGLMEKILSALSATQKPAHREDGTPELESLTVDDLAPIDAFHSLGRAGTEELCNMVSISSNDSVVDIGCGLGGTARLLASTYKCQVNGMDLTREFVDIGNDLNHMVGLDDKVTIVQGSALELPHDNSSFSIAFTEHVQMNIADKFQFYSEIARVLKPGGQLLFHDVFRGERHDRVLYPCPWAEVEEMSQLASTSTIRQAMHKAGFKVDQWVDKTEATIGFFTPVLEKVDRDGFPPLGVHLLMGDNAKEKIMNHVKNLKRGCTIVVMGVAVKIGSIP